MPTDKNKKLDDVISTVESAGWTVAKRNREHIVTKSVTTGSWNVTLEVYPRSQRTYLIAHDSNGNEKVFEVDHILTVEETITVTQRETTITIS